MFFNIQGQVLFIQYIFLQLLQDHSRIFLLFYHKQEFLIFFMHLFQHLHYQFMHLQHLPILQFILQGHHHFQDQGFKYFIKGLTIRMQFELYHCRDQFFIQELRDDLLSWQNVSLKDLLKVLHLKQLPFPPFYYHLYKHLLILMQLTQRMSRSLRPWDLK